MDRVWLIEWNIASYDGNKLLAVFDSEEGAVEYKRKMEEDPFYAGDLSVTSVPMNKEFDSSVLVA